MRMVAGLASGVAMGCLVGLAAGVLPSHRPARRAEPQIGAAQQWLIQAGLDLTPRQFWGASIGFGLVAGALTGFITGLPAVASMVGLIAVFMPRGYYARRRAERLGAVQKAWPDGLRDIVASITAGMSLQRSIENLAASGPAPLRRAFERFPYLARTLGVVAALETIKEELADPTSDRVIEILILAHQRGGAIVPEILRDLAEATVRDVWTIEEIETQSLEQKINARVVFVLPWLVLVAITARPGPFRDFYTTSLGVAVVVVCGILSGIGIGVVSKLGAEAPEPRVLGGAARDVGESA